MNQVSQSDAIQGDDPWKWVPQVYCVFMRLLATVCMVAGISYWALLSGMAGQGALRFDLLAVEPRIAYTFLAVILPFAALGLWFISNWGIAVGLICGLVLVAMHGYWPDIFGDSPIILAAITLFAVLIGAFMVFFFLRWRRQRLSGY